MNKILIIVGVLVICSLIGLGIWVSNKPENKNLIQSAQEISFKPRPSENLKEYEDPTGFKFSFPDDLSIESKEDLDTGSYASLQLFSKDVNGSLSINIVDSKFKSIEEWVKSLGKVGEEITLGNLKAMQVKTSDRIYLGALDSGVLFILEVPLIEEDYWTKVYKIVQENFAFTTPQASAATSGDVYFESEEVVE